MSTEPQSTRFSQPIVNGQSSETSLSSSYNTGKTVYSSESVSSSNSSDPPSGLGGSSSSSAPNQSSSNASQRIPSSNISDSQRNFSSNQSSSNSSSNQSSSAGQSYKPSTDSYKSSTDSYKSSSDSYKQTSDSYKSSSDSYKPSTDSYKSPSAAVSKPSTDSYKPSESYKSSTDSYKPSTDSYKSSTTSNKTSTDSYKPSTDSYKPSTDSYKTSDSFGSSSASSAQSYKSESASPSLLTSNTSGSNFSSNSPSSNTYKSSNLDSSFNKTSSDSSGLNAAQTRPTSANQSSTNVSAQAIRKPESRPVINNNYQQSFQSNQPRPNTTNSNFQQNSSYQPTSNTSFQPSNTSPYQQSNYQSQSYQSQRPGQTPAVPQLKRETSNVSTVSNSSISSARSTTAYGSQSATNQNFQRTATSTNPPQAQRTYTPNQNLTTGQQPRPMSPSVPRPHPNQPSSAAPRPQSYQTQSTFQSNAAQRPISQNYQQSSTVPGRVGINQRPGNTNPNLYSSNSPNYAGGVRTAPLSGTNSNTDFLRSGAGSNYPPRHSDAGVRPFDPSRVLSANTTRSPLGQFASVVEEKRRSPTASILAAESKESIIPAQKVALQSGKLKALIQKKIQPGDKPPSPFQNLNIRQNLVNETIGSYQKRLESEAAKLTKQPSMAQLGGKDVMKKLRSKKTAIKLLALQEKVKRKAEEKAKAIEESGEGEDGVKKKKTKIIKKKVKRKKVVPKTEGGTDGDDASGEKKKEGEEETKEDEYEEVTEEEEVTDNDSEPEEEDDDEDDDDDDEDFSSDIDENPNSVHDCIKMFEANDKAKVPILPKKPPVEKKEKPAGPINVPEPVNRSTADNLERANADKDDGESGVDETPMIHPNLKSVSDAPLKVAKIHTDPRTKLRKTGNRSNTLGRNPSKNGRASYPGTPTKGAPSTPKQHSTPGTPNHQTPKKGDGVPYFNPEEELLLLFRDPNSKFFRHRDGEHDGGLDEDRKDNRPTTNGDIGSPKKTPSKLPGPARKSASATSPTKTPLKSPGTAKSLPKTPETPGPLTPLIKKVPMNKIQVGAAPSPNLKSVTSKIGSLANTTHRPGGGHIKIESHKVDFSKAKPRIAAKNDTYAPGGGDKKIQQVKLQWSAKPKVGSLDNATYKPGGGDKKIESVKLDFKDKAKPKVGSKENVKHVPGGGAVKNSPSPLEGKSPNSLVAMRWAIARKSSSWRFPPIESQKLEFRAQSKIGSLDNVKHKPGGGDVKIFDDKTYLKQVSSAGSEGRASGTQSVCDLSVVSEVQSSSKPGTPGTPDHGTAIKIKKTTTIARTRPEYKKTTEVTVVSRSPSKERKGNIVRSPSTHEVKLTYSKVSSPTKHRADTDNKGPVEVVNVPAKDHAPILKPSVDSKDAPGLEIKNLIMNFEQKQLPGVKDGQSQPSTGSDGKRNDNLPNVTQNKSDSNQANGNSTQNGEDSNQKSNSEKEDGSKLDKNVKNDENIRKSSQSNNPDSKKDDTPISKFLQNEIAAHEKVGEIWKEVQNSGIDKSKQQNNPASGQAPPPPPPNAAAGQKPGYPSTQTQPPQSQPRPQNQKEATSQQNSSAPNQTANKPSTTPQSNANPTSQNPSQPSNASNQNQQKPAQPQNVPQAPVPPPGMPQGSVPGQQKPTSQTSSQQPQTQIKSPPAVPQQPGAKYPTIQQPNQPIPSSQPLGQATTMNKPNQPSAGNLGGTGSLQRLPSDLGQSNNPPTSQTPTGPSSFHSSLGDPLKNTVPKDSSNLNK